MSYIIIYLVAGVFFMLISFSVQFYRSPFQFYRSRFDTNQGRCDRRYYTTDIDSFEYSQDIACEVKSWCAELSIDIKDLNRGGL